MNPTIRYLRSIVSVNNHVDREQACESIRQNIVFRGPNVVILACAIVLASVGLNVNSIPVIIGAMLVSPLMGPIIGTGLGMGINDGELLKSSGKNLLIMVSISIITSTLYFIISPLKLEHPTELLARTNPSIYDVLIAFFGGFAGILETARKEKGTVISGVAIATALMPPLCTAGYGLASLNWKFFFGAIYLFTINSVFIALATFLTVKYLRFPSVQQEDKTRERRTHRLVSILLVILIIPSVISAASIIRQTNFSRNASKFVGHTKTIGRSYIYRHNINTSSSPMTLDLYLAGEDLSYDDREFLFTEAAHYGLKRDQVVLHEEATFTNPATASSDILREVFERNEDRTAALRSEADSLQRLVSSYKAAELPTEAIAAELSAQYSGIKEVVLTQGEGILRDNDSTAVSSRTIAIIRTEKPLGEEDKTKIENWLKVRLGRDNLKVLNLQ